MGWLQLTELSQLDEIDLRSNEKAVLILKHSTRCSISSTALNRMNGGLEKLSAEMDLYYLDLLNHRDISNEIERRYGVHHESPQILLIVHSNCVYKASHLSISPAGILEHMV